MNREKVIQDLLDEAGLDFKRNGRSFILKCPRCGKRDKLYIRKTDGRFVCWVCKETEGFSGAPEWALTELLGTPVAELRARLYGTSRAAGAVYIDLQLDDFFDEDDEVPVFVPDELVELEPDPGFRPLDSEYGLPGLRYLEGRGLPVSLCLEYGIRYWPAMRAVVFPVLQRGRLLGWQTRRIDATEWEDPETGVTVRVPKALTAAGFKKEQALMFQDRITGDHAVLCEGPVDALKAHLCGGNVCALGKLVSTYQLNLLRTSGIRRLYLALDPDAFVEAGNLLRDVADDLEVYDMRPPAGAPEGTDLGKMSLEAVRDLMEAAPRLDRHHMFLYLKDFYVP